MIIFSYLIGLMYHKLMEGATWFLRNMRCLISRGWELAKNDIKGELPSSNNENYYNAYYCLMKNNCLNNIPVLEAQAAFCKDILPILIVVLIRLAFGCLDSEKFLNAYTLATIIVILSLVLIPVWYCTQVKIHRLVWEGYYFICNKCYNKCCKNCFRNIQNHP